MDEIEDPILSQQTSASFHGEDLKVTLLREEQIREVSAYIQLVWDISNHKIKDKRFFTVREIIDYTIDTLKNTDKQSDKFWITEVAAIIREIIDNQYESLFKQYLKCLPNRGDSEDSDKIYTSIQILKDIINDIAHMKYDSAIIALNKDDLKKSFFIDIQVENIDKQILDLLVYNLIDLLYRLFQYCKR